MFTVHSESIDQMNESYIVSPLSCFDGNVNERYILHMLYVIVRIFVYEPYFHLCDDEYKMSNKKVHVCVPWCNKKCHWKF